MPQKGRHRQPIYDKHPREYSCLNWVGCHLLSRLSPFVSALLQVMSRRRVCHSATGLRESVAPSMGESLKQKRCMDTSQTTVLYQPKYNTVPTNHSIFCVKCLEPTRRKSNFVHLYIYIYITVTALSHTQQPFLKGLRESAMYCHLLLIQQMDRGVSHMTQASLFKLERFHVRPIVPIPPWIDGGVMGMVVGTFQGGGLSRKLTFAP